MRSEANDIFRIDSMTLQNFRCFDEKTIEFSPQFNVLIGDNGAGRTAVLDALSIAMGEVVPERGGARQVGSRDVRVTSDRRSPASGAPSPVVRDVPESRMRRQLNMDCHCARSA